MEILDWLIGFCWCVLHELIFVGMVGFFDWKEFKLVGMVGFVGWLGWLYEFNGNDGIWNYLYSLII